MKSKSKIFLYSIILIISMFLLAACGSDKNNNNNANNSSDGTPSNNTENNNGNNNNEEEQPENVTLKFNYGWEDEFNEDIKGPVEDKFPHITLEFVETALEDVEEEIVRDNIPDIYYLSGGDKVQILEEYELTYDLEELIANKGFDLDSISQAQIDEARSWGNGGLYYLPYVKRWEVLYYNKGIFDKFGVDYPVDGMTWNEVLELAKKVTGQLDGVNYRGIDLSASSGMLKQREVTYLDPETDEPMFLEDENFAKYLNMLKSFASIPGVVPEEGDWGDFIGEQNVAMVPLFDVHIWFSNVEAETGLDWDMVSFPVWEDAPNKGPKANAGGLAITRTSEHKEAAFQVLEYLMSEEWQMMRSEKGFATVLNNSEVQQAFSSDVEGLKEKNMQAVFALDEVSRAGNISLYEEEVNEVIDIMEFLREGKDVNTYLREAYEQAEALVTEAKSRN